jgi:hypothetical protein
MINMTEPDPSGSTATDTPSATTTPSGGGAGGGGAHSGSGRGTPAPLPQLLQEGQHDPDESAHQPRWIAYLQQMLNYHYQQEVVPDSGEFEWMTARAVRHFREQNHLPEGSHVDHEFWSKLGIEDTPQDTSHSGGAGHAGGGADGGAGGGADGGQGGDFTDVQYDNVTLVDMPDNYMSWAATLASMANTKGESYTVDSFCEHIHAAKEQKTSAQAEDAALGANLGFFRASVNGSTAADWAAVLSSNGCALWMPDPSNDDHSLIVAGVRHGAGGAEIKVLDPNGSSGWMALADFTATYGIAANYEGDLLGIS